MAITQAVCTSFKEELLEGVHDFSTDVFKLALYTSAATLSAATTAYSATNEVAAGGGYSAGGATLTPTVAIDGTTAYVDFSDVVLTGVTFTARGALIYNSSKADRAAAVLDFGGDKAVSGGTFTVSFPAATAATALIRID